MTYTILVVIVLILVSGFIAYWGDILGRRMGKKRLTLFNLRPRHTAIVVTTITGMLISALVLLAAVSFNAEFRKGFFQYGQILKSRRTLAAENGQLALRSKQLRIEVAKQRKELLSTRNDAERAKAQRDNARSYVTRLQREIARRQKELVELSKRADAVQDELDQRKGEVKLVLAELRVAQEALARAQEDVKATQDKLEVAKTQLDLTKSQLQATEAALSAYDKDSTKALDYLVKLRTSEITFHQGDEIVRGSIDPTRSKYEITRDLERMLDLAGKKVIQGGAKVGENGRAVNVIYRQIEGDENVLLMGNEEKYINLAVGKIMSSDSEVLVQIVCGMSSLTDAQVPVAIRLYLNRLVYANGDKIAQTTIDGSRSEGSILLALNSFLQSDVAKTAAQAGVVPVTGQDPRDALGDNREAQADELLGLMSEIKSVNAAANLSVYATANIRAAESLNTTNIRFAVAKAK
jgi:uncharacterized protein YhaN